MNSLPLRRILTAQTLLTVFLPMVVVLGIGHFLLLPKMRSDAEARLLLIARTVGIQLEGHLETASAMVRTAAAGSEVKSLTPHRQQQLQLLLSHSNAISSMYLVDRGGTVCAAALKAGESLSVRDLLHLDLTGNPFFRELRQGGKPRWSETYLSIVSSGLVAAYGVENRGETVIGELDLTLLTGFLKQIVTDSTYLIMVIDHRGQVIADSNGRFTARQVNIGNINLVRAGIGSDRPTTGQFVFDQQEMTGALVQLPTINWHILVASSNDYLYRTPTRFALISMAGILAALVSGMLASLYLARKLSTRIEALAGFARGISGDEQPGAWPVTRIDEFDQLSESLQRMSQSLCQKNLDLRESEERFRELFQNVPDPVYIADETGWIIAANDQACRELGYSLQELQACHISDVDAVSDTPEKVSSLHEHFNPAVSTTLETLHRRKDGSLFPVEVHIRIITYDDTSAFMGVARNITERKRIEDELKKNERRMASLFDISQHQFTTEKEFLDHALHEVIRLTESAIGYIYYYSERKRQFTLNSWSSGVMSQCDVANRITTIYDLDMTGLWGEAVRQRRPILVNDFAADNPLKQGLPEGHVPLTRFLTVPVLSEGEITAVVGVANKDADYSDADVMQLTLYMDAVWKITARKRAEEEHAKLEKQLLHAQKLESLGVLAGGIAHDFNNILTAIVGNADLALLRLNPESPVLENLQRIEKAASRASDLAKQMLAYSGKGKFIIEAIDFNRLVEEMGHMLEVSISKKAIIRYNLARPLPHVEADPTQIRQIVMNLVINASEAIGDKSGVIAVSTGCLECDQRYFKDAWLDEHLPEGLYVFLEVVDTGCGMDRETVGRIFDPFFTTKFTGRGLGMAAVLGIVRGHRGAIKVYSEPGRGTTFKVLFPASDRPAELFKDGSVEGEWRGSGVALLVDDEETVRAIGAEMLRELGFSVVTAADGDEALEIFRTTGNIGLVILDLTMPHMDGEQCFMALRQMDPNVRIIMSSGFSEHEVTQKFAGKGLAGFVQKPYKVSALRDVLRTACHPD